MTTPASTIAVVIRPMNFVSMSSSQSLIGQRERPAGLLSFRSFIGARSSWFLHCRLQHEQRAPILPERAGLRADVHDAPVMLGGGRGEQLHDLDQAQRLPCLHDTADLDERRGLR